MNNQKNKQINSVALYRFIAILLVVYGHLVTVATYSYDIPDVIVGRLSAPILSNNFLTIFDDFSSRFLHTNSGSLAVVMFFITSGYLISKMMDRYSNKEFFLNRVISIFPTLWVSMLVVSLFIYLGQGLVLNKSDYLASMFPFWPRLSGQFVTNSLWTLRIELKYYFLMLFIWKDKKNAILFGYILIALLIIIYYEYREPWIYTHMFDLSYMCFSFLGMMVECMGKIKLKEKIACISLLTILNIILFKISVVLFQEDRGFYSSTMTHIIPILLFFCLIELEEKRPSLFINLPGVISYIAKMSLPIYLNHVGCGLTVMYHLSRAGYSVYVTLLGGLLTVTVVSLTIYYLVTKPSTDIMRRCIGSMRNRN